MLGTVDGDRHRGRPARRWRDDIVDWCGCPLPEVVKQCSWRQTEKSGEGLSVASTAHKGHELRTRPYIFRGPRNFTPRRGNSINSTAPWKWMPTAEFNGSRSIFNRLKPVLYCNCCWTGVCCTDSRNRQQAGWKSDTTASCITAASLLDSHKDVGRQAAVAASVSGSRK